MAEEIKAKVVETEEKSIQEKEEVVQKNSGFDEESQMYKVDLSKPPKQETDAVQEQSTDEVPVRDESETSGGVQEGNTKEQVEESSGESPSDVRDQEEEEVPIIESAFNSINFLLSFVISISSGEFLFKKQFVIRPAVSSEGISFKACTAISIFLSINSSSIFFENNPFPPISESLSFWF